MGKPNWTKATRSIFLLPCFQRRKLKRTFTYVIDGEIVPEYIRRSEDLKEMGPDHVLHNLVHQCLETVPEDRPSAAEIIETLQKFSTTVEGESSGCFLTSSLVQMQGFQKLRLA